MSQRFVATTMVMSDPSILSRSLEDELLLYNPATDGVVTLDPIGSLLWRLLAKPVSVEQLVADLVERFGVDAATVATDIMPLLQALHDAGLIESEGNRISADKAPLP